MDERTILSPSAAAHRAALVDTLVRLGYDHNRAEEIASARLWTAPDEVSYELPEREWKAMTPHKARRFEVAESLAKAKLRRLMWIYRSTGHAPWKRTGQA